MCFYAVLLLGRTGILTQFYEEIKEWKRVVTGGSRKAKTMQPSLEERGEQDLVRFFFHTLECEAAWSILGGRAGVRKGLIMSSFLLLRKLPPGDV